jgi:hypothetical protein
MSEISIAKSEYETLQDCKVGEPLVLRGTVSAIDGDTLTVDVESAAYDEEAEAEEAPAPKPTKSPVASIGVPMRGKTYA